MTKNDQLADLAARAEGPLLLWGRSLQNFRQVCSLFPSSPFVGRAMGWAIAERPAGHVVELGAGTGAVTRQLLRHGVADEQLTLVEIDSQLGGHLRRSFPGMDVIIAPAQDLAELWRERDGPPVGAVVSTMPLRLFDEETILAIMRSSLAVLEPGGVFVQFTYRQRSPVPEHICDALGLAAEHYCRVWINLPPAGIWVYRKRPESAL
ncbi:MULTISPECIES: methyltransferase domain-containing protein [Rhodomicrobium]|uniref:class I SAM-dependent methyltransferase n=1 Tax=Rhodomicrobium TaxID=1068 RepID=UPI000B4B7E69|nr:MULTISPECIES: methyltransferase domain-containing protein [Rhodomicrobium]